MDTGEDLYAGARVAYERIVAREAADDRIAWRTALMSHGRHTEDAFVLLHGLTASPAQFVEFGHMLHERGANVLIPRLPRHGHARMSRVLAGLTTDELTASARESVGIARGLGERVTVAGFSVGGLMSAWVAQNIAVDRAVCIAPFLGIGWLPQAFGPYVSRAGATAAESFSVVASPPARALRARARLSALLDARRRPRDAVRARPRGGGALASARDQDDRAG